MGNPIFTEYFATMQRIAISSEEKYILDYLITCEMLHGYQEKMVIEAAQIFSLMKYFCSMETTNSEK